jgi:CheY-like chemotaxis protein/anti-sigma regulatory factor (Ser/Thr protein kinase)
MLAFARRQDLTPELVDLASLVRGMTTLMQPALGPAVSIQAKLPLKLNAALVDANQLEMALLNLSVNARDAMPGGGAIVVDLREERLAPGQVHGLGAGLYACLTVKDSGVGMDEVTLSRAMEPFYTTKGPGQGTGLGLSMVHGMAIQAGGRLVLDSEPDRGTVASLWLPLTETPHDIGDTHPFAASGAADRTACTVLAVDDDPLVLLNTVMMLEDLGHTVFEASSGKQALELLAREAAIEIVVTDMAMPHMSGLQLFWMAGNLYPELRFLLATGYAESTDDEAPALLRLAKPFGQDDLDKAIQTAFGAPPATPRVVQFPLPPRRQE